jgi:hypothetical protein
MKMQMKMQAPRAGSAITGRLLTLLLAAFEQQVGQQGPVRLPAGAIYLEPIRVVIAGTACEAPLYDQALRDAAVESDADVVLIRHGPFPETLNDVYFDVAIRMDLGVVLLKDLLLYFRPADGYWLVPKERGPFAALGRDGVRLTFEPPFMTHHYLEDGLTAAAAQIVRAARTGNC